MTGRTPSSRLVRLGAQPGILDNAKPFEYEWRLKLSDGKYRWMLARAVQTPTDKGQNRWFGTVIDVDRQHRLSKRATCWRTNSHRIKNIFAVVSGLVAIRAPRRSPNLRPN